MKVVFYSFLALFISASVWAAAETQPQGAPKNPPSEKAKVIAFSQANGKLSEAFCQKMDQCAAQKIPQGQCVSEMKDTFGQSYNALPKERKFEVPANDLDLCLKSIKDSSCDQLKSTQSLNGCDFIKNLN